MNDEGDTALAIVAVLLLAVVALSFAGEIIRVGLAVIPSRPPIEAYLWSYRGIDVMVQGFIILAAAAAVAALFRVEKGPGSVEEAVVEAEAIEHEESE